MSRISLLALVLFVGSASSQNFRTSNMFHQPRFGGSGFSGLGSFGNSMTSFGGNHGLNTIGGRPSRGSVGSRPVGGPSDVNSQDPPEIRRLLGSTIHGRELRMGELGLPRHGGAGQGREHANGLLRGWDGNPQTLGNRFVDSWSDPFGGRPIPPTFFGTGLMGGRPFFSPLQDMVPAYYNIVK